MRQKERARGEVEDLTLEPLPPLSLFVEEADLTPSTPSTAFSEGQLDEPFKGFELEEEEAELGIGEKEEIGPEQLQEEVAFYSEDITWEYLKGLQKISLLTPAQEVDLAKKIKEGERQIKLFETRARRPADQEKKSSKKSRHRSSGPKEKNLRFEKALARYQQAVVETQKAKHKLVQANLRLVVSIAKRYANRGLSFLDLIQEGNIGLMQALVKFDYTKGYKFSTYASWWIRAAILRAFAEKSRTIRIPNYLFEIKGKLMKTFKSLLRKLGREPTPQELSQETGIPLQDVEKILNLIEEPVSLSMPIGEEDSTLEDLIADEKNLSPSDSLLGKDLISHTRKLLATLSPREEKILRLRFGIEGNGECTLEEIGKQFRLSRERIRQIEARAIERLRDPQRHKDMREYFE